MITRQDFELLAKALAEARPKRTGELYIGEWHQWYDCILAVEKACKESNPNFDVGKFEGAFRDDMESLEASKIPECCAWCSGH